MVENLAKCSEEQTKKIQALLDAREEEEEVSLTELPTDKKEGPLSMSEILEQV